MTMVRDMGGGGGVGMQLLNLPWCVWRRAAHIPAYLTYTLHVGNTWTCPGSCGNFQEGASAGGEPPETWEFGFSSEDMDTDAYSQHTSPS
jgi:hypothetical protein